MRWRNEQTAQELLRHVHQVLGDSSNELGGLGWSFEYSNLAAAVRSSFRFNAAMPDGQRTSAVRMAMVELYRNDALTLDSLTSELERREAKYLRTPEEPWVLLTQTSIVFDASLPRLRYRNASMTFSATRPKGFEPHPAVSKDEQFYGRAPADYSFIRVRVDARCHYAAFEYSLEAVDVIRAAWNLPLGHKRYRYIGNRPIPLNAIVLGPTHSLHRPDGSPATTAFWWEPAYAAALPIRLAPQLEVVRALEFQVRRALKKSPLAAMLRRCLVRYVRALDTRDYQSAFLKLWAVLEELTVTRERDSHKTTVARATAFDPRGPYERLVLHDLRELRNTIVHEGREATDADRVVQKLKAQVERMLLMHIRFPGLFRDTKEYAEFLDLPESEGELHRRIALQRKAIRILRDGDEGAAAT